MLTEYIDLAYITFSLKQDNIIRQEFKMTNR